MTSSCAECRRVLVFEIDSDFQWRLADPALSPLLFEPSIDWASFGGRTIIHDY